MDPFSLPVDPLLNLQNSLEYLSQPALDSGAGSSSTNVPLQELDYSYWLNPTPGAPFDPNVPSTSLNSEPHPSSTPVRGGTPSNAPGRNENARRGASGLSSGLNHGRGGQGGMATNGSLNGLLPSTSGQASFGGAQQDDLFPSAFTDSLAQVTRDYTNHQGDIPVDASYTLPLPLPTSATTSRGNSAQAGPSQASGSQAPKPFAGTVNTSASKPNSSNGNGSGRQQQADESVPEAALHLLRLALPSGSNGSVATNNAVGGEGADASVGNGSAASGGGESNGRAIKGKGRQSQVAQNEQQGGSGNAFRVWEHTDGQPPLQLNVGGAPRPGSGRASAASSNGRSRQHAPAREQREQTASTRAGSEARNADEPSEEGGRRKSGRIRKTILPDPVHFGDSDASMSDEDEDDAGAFEVYDSDSDAEVGSNRKTKGKGKAKDISVAGSATKPKGKRVSEGTPNPTPAKKPRISGEAPPPPRRPRRPRAALNHLVNRTLPADVPIDPAFARFYRAFPISAAFPPDSYVHRAGSQPPAPAARARSRSYALPPPLPLTAQHGSAQPQQLQQNGNNIMVDDPFAALANYQPVASTSAAGRSNGDAASANGSAYETESQDDAEDNGYNWFIEPPADATWNKATEPFNLYAPRFVKGNATNKCGMCPICIEPVARGGFGEEKWLKLKNSSFVYHMSHAHGISNLTGLPFSPPKDIRSVPLNAVSKDAREIMREGLCHKCNKWIALDSTKNVEALVPELFWFKHAKKCHGETRLEGDTECFIKDSVYTLAKARKEQASRQV